MKQPAASIADADEVTAADDPPGGSDGALQPPALESAQPRARGEAAEDVFSRAARPPVLELARHLLKVRACPRVRVPAGLDEGHHLPRPLLGHGGAHAVRGLARDELRVAVERSPGVFPEEQLVEDDAKGVHVRAVRVVVPAVHLGRHVPQA
eukprot:CAMPEP_0206059980 /NCGR_PEP_ID=MMETSP1466-20131121/50250_1 /ASSEMBLY_ACC=CAM_ASM_001126 /TAXON_ID=44452 /ORGANISM="Pavlova gyrans, Strain CCMP608" /LENGTH=151 /DNA_ID=CAMNT_0053435313 /DNA_START=12 /DNA_END=465 /DNA_ORIENTATION=-